MRHRVCYTAEVHRVNWEWATQAQVYLTLPRWCTPWSGYFTSGVGTLGYLSDVDVYALIGSCLGFYVAAASEKHLNRLKQTCTALLSLSPYWEAQSPRTSRPVIMDEVPLHCWENYVSLGTAHGRGQWESWFPRQRAVGKQEHERLKHLGANESVFFPENLFCQKFVDGHCYKSSSESYQGKGRREEGKDGCSLLSVSCPSCQGPVWVPKAKQSCLQLLVLPSAPWSAFHWRDEAKK